MILEQIRLRNFGVYGGEQAIDVRPVTDTGRPRPIVLFGGLNGGGKTTLLDAILLALYGQRARCSKRGQLTYEDFLRQSVHKDAPPDEGTSVAVSFRYGSDGRENSYEVRRAWSYLDNRLKERLEVFRDGSLDRVRTENWSQLVEELIPSALSQLYFFDGDRIRSLAEDENYAEVLGGAIKSLLGLDVVERLIADCDILERRQRRAQLSEQDRRSFDEIQRVAHHLERRLSDTRAQVAAERNTLLRSEAALHACEEEFTLHGGKLAEHREGLKVREGEVRSKHDSLLSELRDLVEGPLPLVLLPDLLDGSHREHRSRVASKEVSVIWRVLEERDRGVVETFSRKCTATEAIDVLKRILDSDRQTRSQPAPIDEQPDLSDRAAAHLTSLLDGELARLRERTNGLVEGIQSLATELEDISRALSFVPDETGLARTAEKLREENRKYAASKERAASLESQAADLTRELEAKRNQLGRLIEGRANVRAEEEDAERRIDLVKRTSVTMQRFLQVSTARKIERLASLITESFQFLLRKKRFVERVIIDPATFTIELLGYNGRTLSRNRLSEGEKQLFAVSVLWGLAKASGRPLPAIIDTPMARLDSEHRAHFVERYLPHASHQVIVFSTDTEIDKGYYGTLRNYTAKSYRLDYCEKEHQTVVRPGYFWD